MFKKRRDILRMLRPYMHGLYKFVWLLISVTVLMIPALLLPSKLYQILVDEVMGNKKIFLFIYIVLGLLLVYLIRLLLDGVTLYCKNKLTNTLSLRLRKHILHIYLWSPLCKIQGYSVGDLKMRFQDDIDRISNFMCSQITDVLYNFILLIASAVICLWVNPLLFVLCALLIVPVYMINKQIAKGVYQINEETRIVCDDYFSFEHNSLQNWKEIKYTSSESFFINKFKEYRVKLAQLGMRGIRYWAYEEIFKDFKSNYLSKVLIYLLGGLFVIFSTSTVGKVIMFSDIFSYLFSSLDTINAKNMELKTLLPYLERLQNLLFNEETTKYISNIKLDGSIYAEIENFSYPGKDEILLEWIRLRAKPGEKIAVLGESGVGKTTLLKLLLGLETSDSAIIRYSDIPIKNLGDYSLYENIGVVFQENYLFNMTIRENLLFDRSEDKELVRACMAADIYDFIMSLPNGFDTVIGECGIKLSGGQRQRLCIARALIGHPKILLLDEFTSAVDYQSQERILKALEKEYDDVTIVFVTHRSDMARWADHVLTIHKEHMGADDNVF